MSTSAVQIESADVLKGTVLAGTLTRSHDDVVFRYHPGYSGAPVATTLPISYRPSVTGGGAVPPFFAGLLPEGRRLTALQARLKTSRDDEFSQLISVGADCIGDVRILAPGFAPHQEPRLPSHSPDTISFREAFAEEIGTLTSSPNVPGVQDKISDQMISVPVAGFTGPAIIKLSSVNVPLLVENEAFFLDVARACGLEIPRSRIVTDREGVTGLVIERFDRRRRQDGTLESLAQEDSVQLAGRWPSAKYRMTTRDVFDAVANVVDAPIVELAKLIRLFATSYLIGNGDLHAKNVSVYFKDGLWRATPAYDIVSTLPYGDRNMAIDLEGRDDNIRARDFVALGVRYDVPERVIRRILSQVTDACLGLISHVDAIGFDEKKSEDIRRMCRKRADDLTES